MSKHAWFRPRRYRHFDRPVGRSFAAKTEKPPFVAKHSFSPFMQFVKNTKRFRPTIMGVKGSLNKGSVVVKKRDIMYASHRDACIYSYYSALLTLKLDMIYLSNDLNDCVIAYRPIGKANYDLSFEALQFANEHKPVVILGFDVSGFFDNLDHGILKGQLKEILCVDSLSSDWYAIFKHITKYRYVNLEALKSHPHFAPRFANGERGIIAPIEEIVTNGIPILKNKSPHGIPQGSPISAVLANLYMLEFDQKLMRLCAMFDAFYRKYSDDILIICHIDIALFAEDFVKAEIESLLLQINDSKTERIFFDNLSLNTAQYLGFSLDNQGAVIRASSLARQWRKLKRAVKRTRAIGLIAIGNGSAHQIYTKKLRRRFASISPLSQKPLRNFSSYGRRSADVFGSKRILGQVRRLERYLDEATREFKTHSKSILSTSGVPSGNGTSSSS